ncbi:DUF1003 domain-containing protein [Caenimonas aquaedulcis]|uniref:DUF1003 domain-containing protein n=1 Tax=Caenimonas aquaedulcis TaxID=2793270 RepID=A0A931MHD1_9BURK|nr:DUF1003 domain-containing protein [Caenimonas aquaedulcis]MBG9388743.1 DUF1003 domain-containing protein [Caenimonas aquaedulcis]
MSSTPSRTEASKAGNEAYRHAETGDDVTRQNVLAMRQLEEAALARRTRADRVASAIARFCGSMTFVTIHVVLFAGWILFNTLPGLHPFDPYPFTFLTLVVSLEAIFLSTFILISQNYDMRIAERRNQLDLQINLLAEQENTKILQILQRIAKKVGANLGDDPEIRALEEATRPESLVEQIEDAYRAGNPPTGGKPAG